ncbi:hypothetical protein LPC08_25385 (plasmid) [Roseomonas sp. OT10]|uniref:hypothetical protein n=1 Tax=Roseomonas cutis TaxID=2897332 RepID=UPI001E388439|nr:hypothetical protein [Roseomonas sp. OT10]UFN51600.1 hypothetical protein LPC08_25385 [Roseomonas sp. OT10]
MLRITHEGVPEHLKEFTRRRPELYDLYLDDRGQALVVKAVDLELMRRGRRPRMIAANLSREVLQRLTLDDLSTLTHYRDCADLELLRRIRPELQSFMARRDRPSGPYYAALSHIADVASLGVGTLSPGVLARTARHGTHVEVGSVKEGHGLRCAELNEADRTLVGLWQSGRDGPDPRSGDHKFRKSFSVLFLAFARLAEKHVLDLYRCGLGVDARDVSITQVLEPSDLWRTYDVQADIPLDVKNATSRRERVRHAFIGKFKRIEREDIAIAGVASQVDYDRVAPGTDGGISATVRQTFLGIASLSSIKRIEHAINDLPNRVQRMEIAFYRNSLPPWAFEFPRPVIDHERLLVLAEAFAWRPETILCAAIARGRSKEVRPYRGLDEERRSIVDLFAKVVDRASYTKATIALFAISEFVNRCLVHEDPTPFVRFLREIVSVEDFTNLPEKTDVRLVPYLRRQRLKYEISSDCEASCCGGLYDPTHSIRNLLELLERCGQAITKYDITFEHFDAPHPHILLGRTTEGLMLTLYAYCGGRLASGAWCNRFPLVVGENAICDGCGRLICDECDFCSEGCGKSRP